MFTDFFYILRKNSVPVSTTEWMALMEALSRGCINSLDDFYFLARAILVKSESYYDHYDVAFQQYFKGIQSAINIKDQVYEWLKDPLDWERLTREEQDFFASVDYDELFKEFEKRLKEQTEQHDGGNYWIGRGGTSPYGHSGQTPAGIRIGGKSGGRHAIQISQERRFRNYRSDITLDVRQIKVALRGLRQLTRIGPEDELDLEHTINATAKNAGEIELKWQQRRKNTVKVLLLMDVGGSMEPFAQLCSQLFSAANSSSHFKDFQYYYFHNSIYDKLYTDIERYKSVDTEHILRTLEPNYKLILVGDARMSPYELTQKYGAIDYFERNELPSITWLKRIAEHFTHVAWLNPDQPKYWVHPTVRMIGDLFPMFQLTLDGLSQAVLKLVVKK